MQSAETANAHPRLQIQDHEQITLRVVYLAVDNRRVTTQGEKGTQLAELDLHVRPYAERHLRLYADTPQLTQGTTEAGRRCGRVGWNAACDALSLAFPGRLEPVL
jgi:hypothetical protein